MLKTLLVLCGALVVSATGLQAQGHESAIRGSGFAGRPAAYRGGYNRAAALSSANRHNGGNYGRYYYLGGIPFFYPYDYYGFGYPYYGGFGGAYGYGYGYGGYPGGDGVNNGQYADGGNGPGNGGQGSGASLPEAVQRQLAKRGYYKGSVDGQFGPASKEALSRFQKKQGLKETGRIDEPTLDALGFTDHR